MSENMTVEEIQKKIQEYNNKINDIILFLALPTISIYHKKFIS